MPQKIFTARPDGEIDYFNQQWMAFTGLAFDQIKGWGWTRFVHPDDVTRNVQRWHDSIDTGRAFQFEHRIRRFDGVYRWHLTRAHAMRDARGNVTMWIGSNTDIDDQKQLMEGMQRAQDRLAHHADELEKEVAERTTELREANSQLEEFVYSIAHDLRHPLRAMQGFSEILLESHAGMLDTAGRDYLGQIEKSAQLMDKLLLDLLAYGRTACGPLETSTVPVERAWEMAQSQASREIELARARIEAVNPLPLVRAHETTLAQILMNLLSNALKFVTPGQQPHVRFFAEELPETVRLWVEDNGIGIAPEYHERIFRVFEQLGGARNKGNGIGLSIVRKGAERMGGRAGVESEPGKGSRFWVELPKA
jgi:PAS domain S-box-containing protein